MYAEEEGSIIDGIHNAKDHAAYIYHTLKLADFAVKTLADFGFGKGILLKEFASKFKPSKILALDPSREMVEELKKSSWIRKYNSKIIHATLQDYDHKKGKPFDLVICNSILQYIPDKEVSEVFKKLSLLAKYVYFAVPTERDYEYMKREMDFVDPYAFNRPKEFYVKAISPYFTGVSLNLLESRALIKESGFVYEFFRN